MVRNGATPGADPTGDYERIDRGQGREDHNNVIRLKSRRRLLGSLHENRRKQELEDMGSFRSGLKPKRRNPFSAWLAEATTEKGKKTHGWSGGGSFARSEKDSVRLTCTRWTPTMSL